MSGWFAQGSRIDCIPADDRAAQYGDGLFETMAVRDGAARFCVAHIARLQIGCSRLLLDCPPAEALLKAVNDAIHQSADVNKYATAKLVLSAGSGPRGYRRIEDAGPIVRVGIFAAKPLPATIYQQGATIRLCASRLAVQPQLAGIKTLNRLEQVLARAEWQDPGIFEGLMLDTGGRLICGTMSNVFMAAKSGLITPAITRCGVSGIMRGQLLRWFQAAGIDCDVRDAGIDELLAADEVFLTNSLLGVIPVQSCGSRRWTVGDFTRKAQALAAANGVPECQA
ncbi:MAG: aminodeoxychorismate lyase [Gammaproteobacteria bacterium]|nr:aminodeoxychorismate lyase [Gammaproteobacteria bacterium]